MKTLLALVILLIAHKAFPQVGDPVVLRVIYKFKHINDLNKPNQPYEEDMILRLGKTESRYGSWTEENDNKSGKNNTSGNVRTAPVNGGALGFVPAVFVKSKGIQDFDLIQYPISNKLVRVIKLGSSNYMVETSLPTIKWKIYEEKKEIGGYACQKATGTYAGRTYIVWFAPELPFRNGPWKLWGLPGLILEAKDLAGEVSFSFGGLNKSEVSESTAARNKRIVKVSEKAFEQAKKAFEQDPIGVYQSQLPIGNTAKVQLAFMDDNGVFWMGEDGKRLHERHKKDLKQRKNNPLELKSP